MANMTFKANLLPQTDLGYELGSSTQRWKMHGSVNGAKIFYGTCSTAAGTTAKVVTCPEFLASDLVTGAIIFVTFTVANTGATGSITMDVNGTGAKNIKEWRNGSVQNIPGTGYLGANQTYLFWYNGTYWCTVMDYDTNDVNRSTNTYPRLITGAVGIGRYSLFMEASDGTYQSITSTFNSNGTSHVKNTAKFKLGRVYYSNRGSDIAANNSTDTTNSWQDQQTSLVDLRYSTNCGQTLVAREPVYLVGTVGTDGYFTLADIWWTQTEPTSEDGKVYIYLGQVYNDTNPYRVAFEIENPAYWYKNGGFRLYGSGRGIANITRNGTTFTVTRDDGSTFTFSQQDNNADIKQNVSIIGTEKAYITGVTTEPTSTKQALEAVADTGVYLTASTGEVSAVRHSFNADGVEKAYITFNTTTNALDFIFV